tara:strand:+ start:843 stop:1043 length:201 start_codon:yes stop_codon:yes gene_type:complete
MVTLVNTSSETLHFPHIGTIEPKGGKIEVSESDAEILLRNKALQMEKQEKFKGTSRDRSMKAVESE